MQYNQNTLKWVILLRKQFRSKKRQKKRVWLKFLVLFILCFFLYQWILGLFLNIQLANSNEEFIMALLKDSNHHLLYEKSNHNIANQFFKLLSNINIKKPVSILETVFGYEMKDENIIPVVQDPGLQDNDEYLEDPTVYIKDPNPTVVEDPIVYIYNTHQLEGYNNTNFEEYNITPNVLMASYLLKEKLNKAGIPTIVETSNISDFLTLNNWDYSQSYQASKFFITDTLNQYPNLKLLIDLHRDAIPKQASTTTIDGKNYAKILFVVGMEHENAETNLALANLLNNKIKEKYPTLSRGVMTKQGKGVNGIYNQNLSPNSVLIECGGNENSIDEVMNTIEVLSIIIKEYLG